MREKLILPKTDSHTHTHTQCDYSSLISTDRSNVPLRLINKSKVYTGSALADYHLFSVGFSTALLFSSVSCYPTWIPCYITGHCSLPKLHPGGTDAGPLASLCFGVFSSDSTSFAILSLFLAERSTE